MEDERFHHGWPRRVTIGDNPQHHLELKCFDSGLCIACGSDLAGKLGYHCAAAGLDIHCECIRNQADPNTVRRAIAHLRGRSVPYGSPMPPPQVPNVSPAGHLPQYYPPYGSGYAPRPILQAPNGPPAWPAPPSTPYYNYWYVQPPPPRPLPLPLPPPPLPPPNYGSPVGAAPQMVSSIISEFFKVFIRAFFDDDDDVGA